MSINLTDEIEVKTKKGKLGAAKQIFLEGDTQTVESEIQDINSRHNDLNSKHESLSSTVSEHTNQIESNQNQITANKSTQDAKNASLDANMAKLNTRDDQITELVRGITATGGASVATTVTYDNTSSHLASATVQGAIDELQGSKIDKTSILQELGNAEDKVMSQKCVSQEIIQGGVYDVSAHNNDAVFESIQALLSSSNLSTLIPPLVRHGGMSIKFIQGSEQSSDNKYVQYRLMANTFSTTVTDWQGVDEEPTIGSNNLVKSGGVADSINKLKNAGYLYAGIATPTTNPGTPEGPVFYITRGKGTYTNFGGINVTEDEVVVLYYDTVWHKNATGIASQEKLTELDKIVVSNLKFITNIKDCFTISENLFRDNCTYIQSLPDYPATIDIYNGNINITQSSGVNKSVIFSIDTEIGKTYKVSIRPSKDLLSGEKITINRSDNSFMGSELLIELDKNDNGVYYGDFTAVSAKSGLCISIVYNTLQISFNNVTIVEKESSKVLFDKLSKIPYTKEDIDAKLGQPTQLQTQSKIVVDAINEVASRPSIEGLITTKVPENLFLGVNTYKSSTVTSCTIQNGNITIVNETGGNKNIVISLPVTKGKTYKFSIDSPVAPTEPNKIRIYANHNVYTYLQHGEGDNYYCEITPSIDEVELEIQVAWNNKSWTISNIKLTDKEDEGGTFLMLEKLDKVPYTKEESDKNFGANVKNRDYPLYITKGTTDFYLYADGLCNHDCKDTDLFLFGWHNLFPVMDNGKLYVSVSAISSGKIGITAIDKRQNNITLDKTIFCKEKPTNPSADYNILFMGDSLVANKILPQSFFEMLTEYGYTNIKSVGRVITSNGTHFEANGGYTWNNYVDNPNTLPPVFDKNWFWDAESNDISLTKYMQTYCGGVGLDCIVCNVLINHIVNNAFSELTPEEIGVKVRYFINKVHTEYPNCKIILNGSHFGHPDFVYPYAERREKIDAIQKVYYEIAKEFTFVYYLDVACYFDGRSGMQVGTRNVNPWSEETEQYVTDTVHPNECGYKMIANADVQCLLNIL